MKKIKPPLLYYCWLFLSLCFFVYSIIHADNWIGKVIIPILISSVLYYFFLNKSCFIELSDDKIIITYLPFKLKSTFPILNINRISYLKGFYDLIKNDNPKNDYIPRICYDTIQIYYENGTKVEIFVNVRNNQFRKIIDYLNSQIRNEDYI
jgi:hypothetical protein